MSSPLVLEYLKVKLEFSSLALNLLQMEGASINVHGMAWAPNAGLILVVDRVVGDKGIVTEGLYRD